ncbi:MAG TPA: hypothetical protein PKH93_06905, partial [Chitinophagales bacterium]|nr:hypothetical protein [Chitinophagales bacterium]
MNRFTSLLGAALLGSIITVGAVKITGIGNSNNTSSSSNFAVPARLTNFMNSSGTAADFTATAETTMPAVVHIKATEGVKTASRSGRSYRGNGGGGMSPFDFFFGDPFGGGGGSPFDQDYGQQEPNVGSGSGVIISNDGYIVTNNHVIRDADKLDVTLYDKRTY